MRIEVTGIPGACKVYREQLIDERGSFARMVCKKELENSGIHLDIVQVNQSSNLKKGTLRGLHLQRGRAAEDKLVSCVSGAIFDVCVDMRSHSPTYGQWTGETLSAENGISLFVPKGCAHGYVTLEDNCQLIYFMSEFYTPGSSYGFRYDDPFLSIEWPVSAPYIISEQDLNWQLIQDTI